MLRDIDPFKLRWLLPRDLIDLVAKKALAKKDIARQAGIESVMAARMVMLIILRLHPRFFFVIPSS